MESAFEQLKARYLKGMSEKREILMMALETFEAAGEGAAEALATIRRQAHRLHGSGGSYGYPEISAAAASLECVGEAEVPELTRALMDVLNQVEAR